MSYAQNTSAPYVASSFTMFSKNEQLSTRTIEVMGKVDFGCNIQEEKARQNPAMVRASQSPVNVICPC